ncbi:MAG: methyltransferase domain-containing protein [Methylobacteriaceae bacterium]|nr:methyltransferase domain-containing protein [Methylobacteriaceae bacterium]
MQHAAAPNAERLVFDRALVRARLARAIRRGAVDFLLARAADDLGDRLATVLREFKLALDLGTPGGHVTKRLLQRDRLGAVVRAAPLREPTAPGLLALVADEEALPFAPARFDLIVSALALQWANDLPGALIQIRRALKPDGLLLGCLVGGRTLFELRQALASAEVEIEGGASPRVAPFTDVRDMGGLLQRAGFALPVADVDTIVVRYADPIRLMYDLRAMGATNALSQRRRTPLKRAVLLRACEVYAEQFADTDGRIRATFELVWFSGWSPHESQPKPARPGSASIRLADALGVAEIRPKDAS